MTLIFLCVFFPLAFYSELRLLFLPLIFTIQCILRVHFLHVVLNRESALRLVHRIVVSITCFTASVSFVSIDSSVLLYNTTWCPLVGNTVRCDRCSFSCWRCAHCRCLLSFFHFSLLPTNNSTNIQIVLCSSGRCSIVQFGQQLLLKSVDIYLRPKIFYKTINISTTENEPKARKKIWKTFLSFMLPMQEQISMYDFF